MAFMRESTLRAVNQSLGRVIRHIDDYGVVYLVDARYARSENKKQISKWARGMIKDCKADA